jgi:hypothetical protein
MMKRVFAMLMVCLVVFFTLSSLRPVVADVPPSLTLFTPTINGLTTTINGVTLPGTSGTSVIRIHWNWGDGFQEDHWFANSHTYSSASAYTVTVTSYQSDGLTTTKTTTVALEPSGDSYEPDNSFSQYSTMTVTTSLQSQSRTIDPAGDSDYIRFQAVPGTYTFYTSSSIDTYGYLYNLGQTELTHDDDSGGNLQFRIVYTVTSSGYYFLRVRAYSSSTTGPYTLYFSYVPSSPQPSGDSYEPNDDFAHATAIGVNVMPTQSLVASIEPAGDNDYFVFHADSNYEYVFYTQSAIATYGYLYDSNQNELIHDDDSGGNYQFHIEYSIFSSGDYYLRVRGYSSSTHGPYTLYYRCEPIVTQYHFLTIQNPAISSDGKTLYFELHWRFLVIPYEQHTYLPFSRCTMIVCGPRGTHLQMCEPVSDMSAWTEGSTEITGALLDVTGVAIDTITGVPISTVLSIAQHASAVQQAFQNSREQLHSVSGFRETLGETGFFNEIVYVVQIKSDTPMNSWQVSLQASAVHMIGPNVSGDTLAQSETITLTRTS